MDVRLIVRHSGRLYWAVADVRSQLLKSIIGFLRNQIALLEPAFNSRRSAYVGEAAIAAEDLHHLSVLYHPGLAENRSDLVAQERLRCRHVRNLLGSARSVTAGKGNRSENNQPTKFNAEFH